MTRRHWNISFVERCSAASWWFLPFFKAREQAEAFLSSTPVVPQSPLFGPNYALFTEGSASASPPFAAGWGLHILDPAGRVTHKGWGPVCLDPYSPAFVGAFRYTNNSGELTALISALKWICALPSYSPLQLNLYTDSDYSQKHLLFPKFPGSPQGSYSEGASSFGPGSSGPCVIAGLDQGSYHEKIHRSNGNWKANSLALLGRRKLARSLAPKDLLAPRPPFTLCVSFLWLFTIFLCWITSFISF